jgi:hypothetical protein
MPNVPEVGVGHGVCLAWQLGARKQPRADQMDSLELDGLPFFGSTIRLVKPDGLSHHAIDHAPGKHTATGMIPSRYLATGNTATR